MPFGTIPSSDLHVREEVLAAPLRRSQDALGLQEVRKDPEMRVVCLKLGSGSVEEAIKRHIYIYHISYVKYHLSSYTSKINPTWMIPG